MTVVDAAAPASPATRFLGQDRAYWRLLVRGAVLLIVTLGIYRFWLATDVRRFLWSSTEVDGQSLEYTGTPVELLLGFLIAIALLVPIYSMFFIAALGLGTLGQMMSALGFVVLALLGQYAVYRARRYRLTRTVFRGVRFHQEGSAWRYAICALFWWGMIALTLGLAYPWAQASLERFKMQHTFYGNLPGRFEGSAWRLFFRGVPLWLLVMGPFAAGLLLAVTLVDWGTLGDAAVQGDFFRKVEGANTGFAEAIGLVTMALVWAVTAAALLYPAFQALVLRWWTSGLRFGEVAMTSRLRTGQVYRVYARFLWYGLLFALIVSLGAGIGLLVVGVLTAGGGSQQREVLTTGALVIGYVMVALGFSTIYQATVKLGLWRIGVESLDLSGTAALGRVRAAGRPSSAVGEGLADALNLGGL
jgi:uncharacterized membrane protein YjgN (DUF898 family)